MYIRDGTHTEIGNTRRRDYTERGEGTYTEKKLRQYTRTRVNTQYIDYFFRLTLAEHYLFRPASSEARVRGYARISAPIIYYY